MRSGPSTSKAAELRLQDRGDAPLDLLDVATSRQLVKSAAGRRVGPEKETDDFVRDDTGKMLIRDEELEAAQKKRKRRGADYDSDDSDFDDMRGIADLSLAMKSVARSVRFAPSSAGRRSQGGPSSSQAGGQSLGGRSAAGHGGRGQGSAAKPAPAHSGDRFKAKHRAGGDTKGSSKVEPYAYWSFDRKMLNRRAGKKATASKSLKTIVKAVKTGAAKATTTKQHVKRQRVT